VNDVCEECGLRRQWGGSDWLLHTTAYHQAARRWMMRTVHRQLGWLTGFKEWRRDLAEHEMLGFRWRNSDYPGWRLEDRWPVPREWWLSLDDTEVKTLLDVMRTHLSDMAKKNHGVDVTPDTWFYEVWE
jgi:hypothetical protein